MSDHLRCVELLDALSPGCCNVRSVIIDGAPSSKARPRFARSNTYRSKEDRESEQRTAWHLRRSVSEPMTGNVALACIFYRPNRQRIDADNMMKHVCDAANGVLWLDDSQVTAIASVVELDATHPRTVVAFTAHASSLIRDRGTVRQCERCGKPFTQGSKPQKLCSHACQVEAQRERTIARTKNPKTPCVVCGGPTSKSGVQRCRPCWANRGRATHPTPGAVVRVTEES
jgi:Holliday junction resolvase RusA-like endonuclease